MPLHLAAGPSAGTASGPVAAVGAAVRPGGVPAQSRRARRAALAAPVGLPSVPVMPAVPVLLPEAWELLAADAALDEAPLVSPRAEQPRAAAPPGRRPAPEPAQQAAAVAALPRQRVAEPAPAPAAPVAPLEPAPRPSWLPASQATAPAAAAPATPAPAAPADVRQPMTRRARREIEQLEAALALPAVEPLVAPRSELAPGPAAAPSPGPTTGPTTAPTTGPTTGLAPGFLAELARVEALRAAPAPVAPAPVAPAPAAAPPTLTVPVVPVRADAQPDARAVAAPAAFEPSRGRRSHRHPVRATFGLPQVGMVGVLGLATLVAPITGQATHATADTGAAGTTEISVVPAAPLSGLDVLAPEQSLVAAAAAFNAPVVQASATQAGPSVEDLMAEREAADQASRAIGERTLAQQAEEQRQAEEAALLASLTPGCDGVVSEAVLEAPNGRLDTDGLCELWEPGDMLRADAALALAKLNVAYRAEFGEDIALTDSYRSYASQVAVKRSKPGLAARPGTSQHGWGLAVDLGGGVQRGDRHYDWLADNAPQYGWENPDWAQRGGSGPYEPWHWEFAEGRDGASTGSEDQPA